MKTSFLLFIFLFVVASVSLAQLTIEDLDADEKNDQKQQQQEMPKITDPQQLLYYKADTLDKAEKYLEAAEVYHQAALKKKDSSDAVMKISSRSYSASGICYYLIGQFDKAIEAFQNGQKIDTKIKNEEGISTAYNNIGMVYKAWGNYEKALEFYQQALDNYTKNNNKDGISTAYNNIGVVYDSKDMNDKALDQYLKSFKIDLELDNVAKMAIRMNNIGSIYVKKREYDKALKYFMDALQEDLKLENKKGIATRLNNIASVYQHKKQYNQAISYYQEALKIDSSQNNQKSISERLNNIGYAYKLSENYDEAIKYFLRSVEVKEKLRLTAPGDIRRDYLASQIDTYQNLILSYIKKNDFTNAFRIIELSSSKVLAERLSKSSNAFTLTSLETLQKNLDPKTVVLIFTTIDQPAITLMSITNDKANAIERSKSDFVNTSLNNPNVKSFIMSKIPFEELEKFQAFMVAKQEDRDKKFEEKIFETVIHSYRDMLMKPKAENESKLKELSKLFYNFLIDPVKDVIAGHTNLLIAPGGILGYLPFETLLNADNKYIVENFDITYTQSLSVSEMLKTRKYPTTRKSMLALGGAVYNEKTYKEDMSAGEKLGTRGSGMGKINPKQLSYIQKKVDKAIAEGRALSDEYKTLGYEKWSNLKGSLVEVRAITKIVNKCDTIVGAKVSESTFKSLAKDKKLGDYKVLHFSCHGMTIPELPEMSALVLSQIESKNVADNQDGYLRMGEIADLNLQADFVNLSACETGLGKIYSGEGVVGLSQSFLIAGANGISVSLWEVADKSTAQFMVEMYKQAENEHMTYAQAINIVKRKFINGDFGSSWKMPFFWAPFVYYGQ